MVELGGDADFAQEPIGADSVGLLSVQPNVRDAVGYPYTEAARLLRVL